MTAASGGHILTVTTFEDIHLWLALHKEGVGDAYRKRACIIFLSAVDMKKLGVNRGDNVRLTAEAGSIVVEARQEQEAKEGYASMPLSLYSNYLAPADEDEGVHAGRRMQVEVMPAGEETTPPEKVLPEGRHA